MTAVVKSAAALRAAPSVTRNARAETKPAVTPESAEKARTAALRIATVRQAARNACASAVEKTAARMDSAEPAKNAALAAANAPRSAPSATKSASALERTAARTESVELPTIAVARHASVPQAAESALKDVPAPAAAVRKPNARLQMLAATSANASRTA